jgi:hypothetical protein
LSRHRARDATLGYNRRDDPGEPAHEHRVTMARYRIVHWREIPSLVEAIDGADTARRPLSQRFQDLIDAVAMREGASETDAYLDGWGQTPDLEREGAAADVADQLVEELESRFDELARIRLLPPR